MSMARLDDDHIILTESMGVIQILNTKTFRIVKKFQTDEYPIQSIQPSFKAGEFLIYFFNFFKLVKITKGLDYIELISKEFEENITNVVKTKKDEVVICFQKYIVQYNLKYRSFTKSLFKHNLNFDCSLAAIPQVSPSRFMLWGWEQCLTLLERQQLIRSVKKLDRNKLIQINLLEGLIEWENDGLTFIYCEHQCKRN